MTGFPSKEIHGYDASRFEETVDAIFHCSICFDVLKEPRSCRNNDHLFCLDCISEYLKGNSQTCPECQENLSMTTLRRPRVVSNYISKFKINCDYAKRGCPEYICVESLENHVKDCGYAPVICSNEHCGKEINKREISHHENEVCKHRKVKHHGYGQRNDFGTLQRNAKEELKKMNEKVEKGFKKINEAVEEELRNVNAKVEQEFRNMNEKIEGNRMVNKTVEAETREMKKEVEGVKENLRDVQKNMDEVKVMMSKMMEKLNQVELVNKLQSLTEGMLNTPREDILIAGDSQSTEIYSWEKNAWFEVSPMNEKHEAASSYIQNHQLFVVGGLGTRTIETLDLKESHLKWMKFPTDLPYGCSYHKIVVYQQRIIHIGGCDWEKHEVSNVINELQLAPHCIMKELCRMPEPRDGHCAEIFQDKVLILGGQNKDDGAIDTVLEVDLKKKKCTKKPSLPRPLRMMATARWRDKVVVLGGMGKEKEVLNDGFMYDCKTGETTALPSMMEKRVSCSVVITGDTFVVMGGLNEKWDELSSVECFTMGSFEWKYLPAMNEARCNAIAEVLPSTRKYV